MEVSKCPGKSFAGSERVHNHHTLQNEQLLGESRSHLSRALLSSPRQGGVDGVKAGKRVCRGHTASCRLHPRSRHFEAYAPSPAQVSRPEARSVTTPRRTASRLAPRDKRGAARLDSARLAPGTRRPPPPAPPLPLSPGNRHEAATRARPPERAAPPRRPASPALASRAAPPPSPGPPGPRPLPPRLPAGSRPLAS